MAEERVAAIPAAVRRSLVPPKFQRADLSAPPAVMDAILDDSEFPAGLFLHGEPGVGKSMAMGLMVREWFRRWGQDPRNAYDRTLPDVWRWVDYPAFTMEIQDAFKNGDGETTAYRLLKALALMPRLVIDDLGVEKGTAFVVQATYYILDQREKWMRPTYITTNVPLAELDDQYGARITDRIAGTCAVKEVVGKSRRLKP